MIQRNYRKPVNTLYRATRTPIRKRIIIARYTTSHYETLALMISGGPPPPPPRTPTQTHMREPLFLPSRTQIHTYTLDWQPINIMMLLGIAHRVAGDYKIAYIRRCTQDTRPLRNGIGVRLSDGDPRGDASYECEIYSCICIEYCSRMNLSLMCRERATADGV